METEQLETLYQLYAQELLLYATCLTKNKADAEELVSDAFFQLALQTTFPAEPKFWLLRVVKNRFFDRQRQKKRWGWKSLANIFLTNQETPETILFQTEQYQALYQGLDNLTSPYQEVLIFFYFLNWSTQEISAYLGLNPGQVRTILHRGRKKLKEEMTHD